MRLALRSVSRGIAFSINVSRNVMGDLARVMTEAHAKIARRRTEPDRAAFVTLRKHQPQAHMIAAVRAAAYGLFKREILAAAFVEKSADRCTFIGAVQHNTAGNCNAAAQGDCIGGIASRRPA